MKNFNVSLLSLAAIALVGSSVMPAYAGGCCKDGAKKDSAKAEECTKDKASAETKEGTKVSEVTTKETKTEVEKTSTK